MLANPLAVLYPIYSSSEHTLRFETVRPWEVVSAAKFARGISSQKKYLGLINAVAGDLNNIHYFAYGGKSKEA